MNAEVNARSSGVQDLAFTFAFAFSGNERRSRSRSPIYERVRERRSFERRSLMLWNIYRHFVYTAKKSI